MLNLIKIIKLNKSQVIIASLISCGILLIKRKLRTSPEIKALRNLKLEKKIAIVTGSNSGIGYETALDFAYRGATVILACRDSLKTRKALERIKSLSKNPNVFFEELDLSRFESVKLFSGRIIENYDQVDILVNNAGISGCPKQITQDGFDLQLQTNYLGHYLLTRLLIEKIKKSQDGRIINLTSLLYQSAQIYWDDINMTQNYEPSKMYKESKLCLILFTNYLKSYLKQLGDKKTQVYSVSPGLVLTNLARYTLKDWKMKIIKIILYPLIWLVLKTPKQGSECSIYCSIKPGLIENDGFYFRNCKQVELLPHGRNKDDANKLWNLTEHLINEYHV